MQALILDEAEARALIERRRAHGGDRYDEVWDGVYVMAPLASNEHQRVATELTRALAACAPAGATVLAGANVSDRDQGWERDYRCPDVVVVLPGSLARDAGTHWVGGPDLLVEVVSPNDRSRDKLPFYSRIGVRELLLVDRDGKGVERFILRAGALVPAGATYPGAPAMLALETLPVAITSSPTPPHLLLRSGTTGASFRL